MRPRIIKSQEELSIVEQKLSLFYKERPDHYGLMDRNEQDYQEYVDLIEKWTPKGATVLDFGCGTHRTPVLINKRGFQTTGCDIFSKEKLKEYRSKIGKAGPELISYDGYKLPFENETFHTVASLCVLEHTTRVDSLLSEMARVTRPGGKIIIVGPNLSGPHRAVLAIINLLRGAERFWQYQTIIECASGFFKSLSWTLQIKLARSPNFIYIYPLMENGKIKFEDADDDAIHLNVPASYKKWFNKKGFSLLEYNKEAGIAPIARLFNRAFPSLATKIQIVAEKN